MTIVTHLPLSHQEASHPSMESQRQIRESNNISTEVKENNNQDPRSKSAIDAEICEFPPHYPLEEYKNKEFNCIVFEIEDYFCAYSADCKGVSGEGSTVEEAVEELRTSVQSNIESETGGIFLSSCSPADQFIVLKSLIDGFVIDNIVCKSTHQSSFAIFRD